jgi:hypothetical protein
MSSFMYGYINITTIPRAKDGLTFCEVGGIRINATTRESQIEIDFAGELDSGDQLFFFHDKIVDLIRGHSDKILFIVDGIPNTATSRQSIINVLLRAHVNCMRWRT